MYVYADSGDCKCIYVASEANYQKYQRIALKQRAANEESMDVAEISMAQENVDMNWDVWAQPLY